MRNTSTELFFSKSPSAGSIRWRVEVPDASYVRGYVLDGSFQHLSPRWQLLWLGLDDQNRFCINVTPLGDGGEQSLEPADLATALADTPPLMRVTVPVEDEAVAVERFERAVSNVMHNLLTPQRSVLHLWEHFATTQGDNPYRV